MKVIFVFLLLINVLLYESCAQQPKDKLQRSQDISLESKLELTEQEWKKKLTPEQYHILREKGTERPFTGEFVFKKDNGTYMCVGCGEPLFTQDMKFDSHCGWPSFDTEIAGGKIVQSDDFSGGMKRIEITCAKCGGHLGHLFDDGPTQTGLRYCVNSGSLTFEPIKQEGAETTLETITLGGGCFWCIEAIFDELKGVRSVVSGYCGGTTENPTYKQVCEGNTGHAEVVQISYDPNIISLESILEVFFTLHNPTTLNQQGADIGTQYRSAIYYHTSNQREVAIQAIAELNREKVFENPIITEVSAFNTFYVAENFHQEYYELNKEEPYCKAVIQPKMEKLHKVFANKLKKP